MFLTVHGSSVVDRGTGGRPVVPVLKIEHKGLKPPTRCYSHRQEVIRREKDSETCEPFSIIYIPDTTHGTAIYANIDPQNHPNVGIYGSPMECLGISRLNHGEPARR